MQKRMALLLALVRIGGLLAGCGVSTEETIPAAVSGSNPVS